MNCFHRLVIGSFFSGCKEEIYRDLTCYTGVDFENQSTVITGDSLSGNVVISAVEKKNCIDLIISDMISNAEVKVIKSMYKSIRIKMTDSAPMYKFWERAREFLDPKYVLNRSIVGVSNVVIDNALTNILDTKIENDPRYEYTGEYAKFKIMGSRTVDHLILGIKDEMIVLSALVRKGFSETEIAEELTDNITDSRVVYNFVDSVQLINM